MTEAEKQKQKQNWIKSHVPYRLQILLAFEAYFNWYGGPNGPLAGLYPSIHESTLIACRWLMQFLGLRVEAGKLVSKTNDRRDGDVVVTDVGGKCVDVSTLKKEDKELLARLYVGANKATAHPTAENGHDWDPNQTPKAVKILHDLTKSYFYDVVGQPVPKWRLGAWRHN